MAELRPNILVVEDDPNMGLLLEENLRLAGFVPQLVIDGVEAISTFRKSDFDLCLVDIMLPKKDGFQTAREIRELSSKTPVIFLTARSMTADKIEGFKAGCDDYVTKPFDLEELILRIRAVLNRTGSVREEENNLVMFGQSSLDQLERVLLVKETPIRLSAKECELLRILAVNIDEVVSRSDILKQVWGSDNYFSSKSMDVYLSRVRKYLRADSSLTLENIHGFGYKLLQQSVS